MTNKEKVEYIFNKLNMDTMHLIDEFYDPQVKFQDPVETITGSQKVKKYYENMYKNVKDIHFEFSHFVENGDDLVGIWKMTLVTDKLNGGKPISVDGNSVIKFKNGKAVYHRDYFDMGAFVYEQVPVLSFVIRKIKEGFKLDHE